MRPLLFSLLLAAGLSGQSLVENAAAATGGSVGGVAGRKVGEGISNIFNKLDKTASKAAKTGAVSPSAPDSLMEVGPGVPNGGPSVPPPPPLHHAAAHRAARAKLPEPASVPDPPRVTRPAEPEPPEATLDDVNKLAAGMDRDDVVHLAPPSVRITMVDDGHLVEIYRYMVKDTTIGVVRLIDGSVASVQTR